jgi:hypothetical protein
MFTIVDSQPRTSVELLTEIIEQRRRARDQVTACALEPIRAELTTIRAQLARYREELESIRRTASANRGVVFRMIERKATEALKEPT